MSIFKKMASILTNEELAKAFEEIECWRTGQSTLPDGIVRTLHAKVEEMHGEEQDLHITEDVLLYEMAGRFVNQIREAEKEALKPFPLLQSNFLQIQSKYLVCDITGEAIGFVSEYLVKCDCEDLQSELVELFLKGYYYTSNEPVVKEIIRFLESEKIVYELLDEKPSFGFKYKLSIKND